MLPSTAALPALVLTPRQRRKGAAFGRARVYAGKSVSASLPATCGSPCAPPQPALPPPAQAQARLSSPRQPVSSEAVAAAPGSRAALLHLRPWPPPSPPSTLDSADTPRNPAPPRSKAAAESAPLPAAYRTAGPVPCYSAFLPAAAKDPAISPLPPAFGPGRPRGNRLQ